LTDPALSETREPAPRVMPPLTVFAEVAVACSPRRMLPLTVVAELTVALSSMWIEPIYRPGIIRGFSGGYMNGSVDLGGAIAINRDIAAGKRQNRRYCGNDPIAARRSHRGSPAQA